MKKINLPALLLFTFLFSISHVFSQKDISNARLKHFLRKTSADTLLFPGDLIVSENLLINVPDSIYDTSEIEIKKFSYQNIANIHIDLTGRDGIVRTIEYRIKGRRKAEKFHKKMMKEVFTHEETSEKQKSFLINGVLVNFSYTKEKRNHFYRLKIVD
jgi:hypothetical protein